MRKPRSERVMSEKELRENLSLKDSGQKRGYEKT